MSLDAVSDYAGALAGGGWGVHTEAADAAAVDRSVGGIGRSEWQVLEDGRVEHAQTVQAACWPALVVADRVHGRCHTLPPCCRAWRAPLAGTSKRNRRPLAGEPLQAFERFVQVPHWYAAQRPRPGRQQRIVRRLIAIDHIGDQRPVESRVPVPVIDPPGVSVHVEGAALGPDAKGAVVEHERLADLCDDAHVILAREGHQRVPTGKEPGAVLAGAPNWRAVVMDHGSLPEPASRVPVDHPPRPANRSIAVSIERTMSEGSDMSICITLTDADWSLTKDVFVIIGVVVSGVAVWVAFYIGSQGLDTWRRQLKGASDHQLSRRALIELYAFRDAMSEARSPLMLYSVEMEEGESFQKANHRARCRNYEERLDKLSSARRKIQVTLLESEALWGVSLKNLVNPLFQLHGDYVFYLQSHLLATDPDQPSSVREEYSEEIKGLDNILYERLGFVKDEFKKAFDSGLDEAVKYLRSMLLSPTAKK